MIREIRYFENVHVLFWLLKDSCWMMDWQFMAIVMFFPTLIMSGFICYQTRSELLMLLPNTAILCWICANSVWMFGDFFHFKFLGLALVFFAAGVILICFYLYKILVKSNI